MSIVAEVRKRLADPPPSYSLSRGSLIHADLARLCDRGEVLEAALQEIASFDTSGIDRWPSIVTAMRRIATEALG